MNSKVAFKQSFVLTDANLMQFQSKLHYLTQFSSDKRQDVFVPNNWTANAELLGFSMQSDMRNRSGEMPSVFRTRTTTCFTRRSLRIFRYSLINNLSCVFSICFMWILFLFLQLIVNCVFFLFSFSTLFEWIRTRYCVKILRIHFLACVLF